ncbi:hypothetical protein EJB05_14947 [Eragrostis curvula]|uniref:Uncharacterized protein n=1 Tax=Eragrostis curvula TaxID=38414 RepID=A0A5J9W265_9POAL|nr:hypothetical protein EJB05_14947 [Eragrostis curvula]
MIEVSNWVQRRRPGPELRPSFSPLSLSLHHLQSSDSSVSLSSCPVLVQRAPVVSVDLEEKRRRRRRQQRPNAKRQALRRSVFGRSEG